MSKNVSVAEWVKTPGQRAVEQAAKLGKEAFIRGALRVPALDPNLPALLAGSGRIGASIPILNAWLRAWDLANLAPAKPCGCSPHSGCSCASGFDNNCQ